MIQFAVTRVPDGQQKTDGVLLAAAQTALTIDDIGVPGLKPRLGLYVEGIDPLQLPESSLRFHLTASGLRRPGRVRYACLAAAF